VTSFDSIDELVEPPDMVRLRELLPSTLDVAGLAVRSVSTFASAVNRHLLASGLHARPWSLDADRIAASYGSERLLRVRGEATSPFAELSGFFATNDGWIRTHANYPHHRLRLCAVLGLSSSVTASEFAAKVASLSAAAVEETAWQHGALAVRVRDPEEWQPTTAPLIAATRFDQRFAPLLPGARSAARPLQGVRVLDLTRVIAGPVATRSLALLGADVLRIDPPSLPEPPLQHVDTGQGKRSAFVDGAEPAGAAVLNGLLADAQVLVTGYRPGAIEALGLELPPGLIHATVDAWGDSPGWRGRRGFDSLVQAATGISVLESRSSNGDRVVPGALPVQALDHSAGYLLAAAVVDALTARQGDPLGRRLSVSLSTVAAHLLRADRYPRVPQRLEPSDDVVVTHGDVRTARPALAEFSDYGAPAHPLGADTPAWRMP
jgi:crotonobetainyl-CoA:carnitine CoA-transferase CaiB-like acyl-CoA transferase